MILTQGCLQLKYELSCAYARKEFDEEKFILASDYLSNLIELFSPRPLI